MDPRGLAAIWLAKIATLLSRATGKGGSTFPGRVALAVDPWVLRKMGSQAAGGGVLVTGTNGKTTTSRMISAICAQAGLRVVGNRTGANLIYGVVSAFVQSCDITGRLRADVGIIEVDEATMPAAAAQLRPRGVVVTNFFRDQLDRFGELATTVLFVKRGLNLIPEDSGAFVALNSDDPLVASLGGGRRGVVYYGVEDRGVFSGDLIQSADIVNCLECGSPYQYDGVFYAHLGIYKCPSCGASRVPPGVALTEYLPSEAGSRLTIHTPLGAIVVDLKVPGIYNGYNALAATACCLAMGLSPEQIRRGLETYSGSFGRMETIDMGGKRVLMALVKNPAGFNEVLRTVAEAPGRKHLVICINDNYADGTDISWLWDVDFERLAGSRGAQSILVSGIRAEDMAVRLKYAGVDPAILTIEGDLGRALRSGLSDTPDGGTLYVLPTYTAMLEMRKIIHDMGHAKMFWED